MELLAKLQFKDGMRACSSRVPEDLLLEFQNIEILENTGQRDGDEKFSFFLAFVRNPAEVELAYENAKALLKEDALLWFCYPKKSSVLYSGEISRDYGWEHLFQNDLLPVRIVSVSDDWSALRFRHRDRISKITRKF
jgi:hypothetical protein